MQTCTFRSIFISCGKETGKKTEVRAINDWEFSVSVLCCKVLWWPGDLIDWIIGDDVNLSEDFDKFDKLNGSMYSYIFTY